jgi:hypothetical protein
MKAMIHAYVYAAISWIVFLRITQLSRNGITHVPLKAT